MGSKRTLEEMNNNMNLDDENKTKLGGAAAAGAGAEPMVRNTFVNQKKSSEISFSSNSFNDYFFLFAFALQLFLCVDIS